MFKSNRLFWISFIYFLTDLAIIIPVCIFLIIVKVENLQLETQENAELSSSFGLVLIFAAATLPTYCISLLISRISIIIKSVQPKKQKLLFIFLPIAFMICNNKTNRALETYIYHKKSFIVFLIVWSILSAFAFSIVVYMLATSKFIVGFGIVLTFDVMIVIIIGYICNILAYIKLNKKKIKEDLDEVQIKVNDIIKEIR